MPTNSYIRELRGLPRKQPMSNTGSFVIALILLFLVVIHFWPATDPDRAQDLLEAQGYTEVEMTGWDYWGCGEDDFYTDAFEAVSVNGSDVEGVVCCGLFKSCTVRIDHIQPRRDTHEPVR